MSLDPAWGELQRRLLEGLADGSPVPVLSAGVRGATTDAAAQAWVEQWDADLLELAELLVGTWCRRDVAADRARGTGGGPAG